MQTMKRYGYLAASGTVIFTHLSRIIGETAGALAKQRNRFGDRGHLFQPQILQARLAKALL